LRRKAFKAILCEPPIWVAKLGESKPSKNPKSLMGQEVRISRENHVSLGFALAKSDLWTLSITVLQRLLD
jgi:hypothetical protein